jgi:hypothetical protein
MGLDAYVYRNRTHLAFDPNTAGVSVDDKTGVVDFDDPDLYRRFADHVVAIHYRLGNVTSIAQLREELRRCAADLPIIKTRVLGDGTHCGDFIDLSLMEALQQELDLLSAAAAERSPSPHVEEFILQMRELIRMANAENNPIYFG